jgi:hypothetical protein
MARDVERIPLMPIFLIALLALGAFALYETQKGKKAGPSPYPLPGPQPGPLPPQTGPVPPPPPNVTPTVYGDTPVFQSSSTQLLDGHAYYVDIKRGDVDPSIAANPEAVDPTFGGTAFENLLDAHFFQNGAGDYRNFGIDNSDPNFIIANFVAVGNTQAGGSGLAYAIHDMGLPGGGTAATSPEAQGGGSGGGPLAFQPAGQSPGSSHFFTTPSPHAYRVAGRTASSTRSHLPTPRGNTSGGLWRGYAAPGSHDEPK